MSDSPLSPRRERALLAHLAPDVDAEAAWADLRHRFERDRRHRRTVGVASAAAVLVVLVLVVGAGFAARRPADPVLRVGGSDPAGDAPGTEGGTAPSGLPVVPPTVVHISCSDGVGAVDTATAVAGSRGVTLSLGGSSEVVLVPTDDPDTVMSFSPPMAVGDPVGGGAPDIRSTDSELEPRSYEVRCGSTATPGSWTPIGTLEVVDPNAYYVAPTEQPLSCSPPKHETYLSRSMAPEALVRWRLGDSMRFEGYSGLNQRELSGPDVQGRITELADELVLLDLTICPGSYPLPNGELLSDGDSLRSEAEALAWLDATVGGAEWAYGLPPGATETARSAKLVRQDEGAVEAHVHSEVPSLAGWLVRVDFVDADGVANVKVYSFSASAEQASLGSVETAATTPGWPEWFDGLANQAPG